MSSQSDAAGNMDRLRKIFHRGKSCVRLYDSTHYGSLRDPGKIHHRSLGREKYVTQGYPVLLTLILPYTLMLVQSASSRILFGMSKHGRFAVVTLIEGASNVILSILLVRPFGILGDAFGTAIPLAVTFILFMPFHLCSRLCVRISTYLREAYLLPLLLCTPLVSVLLLMRRWFVPHTYRELAVQLLAGGLVYAVSVGWAYATGRALHVADLAPTTANSMPEAASVSTALGSYHDEV